MWPLKIFAIELAQTSHQERWDQRNPASSSNTMVSVVANGMRVGIISDTHGLMRPEAIAALRGSDLIVHAGDIGRLEVLEQLRDLAPTHAVRGNIDIQPWARKLPDTAVVRAGRQRLFVLHDISQLDIDPLCAGYGAVVFGHSHRPSAESRDGVLFINPGSAGPRRFALRVTLARIQVAGKTMRPTIITLA